MLLQNNTSISSSTGGGASLNFWILSIVVINASSMAFAFFALFFPLSFRLLGTSTDGNGDDSSNVGKGNILGDAIGDSGVP